MTGRTVPEWIAKHPDQKVPPRVRVRIFDREHGICHISGRKIVSGEAWELEHKVPLHAGGEHRENNLYPALVEPHKIKTRGERRLKAKVDKVRKKHLGIRATHRPMPGSRASGLRKRMNGQVERRT